MWTWILTDGIEILASGSWQGVIEAGEEIGVVQRRYRDQDGFETSPILRRGVMMIPAGMLPIELDEYAYA